MTWIDVAPAPSRSRHRGIAFFLSFLCAIAGSLFYVYTRPPEYRAVAQLRIVPSAAVSQVSEANDTPTLASDSKSFLSEVQVLTSRPLLTSVLDQLKTTGTMPHL